MKKLWLELQNMSYTYPNETFPALRNVDLHLYYGETVLILGANGSGKSTFLKLLQGTLPDEEQNSDGRISRYDLEGKTYTFSSDVAKEKLANLDQLKKQEDEKQTSNYLSPGERDAYVYDQFLSPALPFYFFDEPLKRLSGSASRHFVKQLKQLDDDPNTTIMVSDQRLEDWMGSSVNRVLVFSVGRLVFDGSIEELLKEDILLPLGIKEPLYVTAMRYSGYPLEDVENIQNPKTLYAPNLRQHMEEWIDSIPQIRQNPQGQELLRLANVSFKYSRGKEGGISHLNMTLHAHEIVSVIGENGAGKTTVAQIVTMRKKIDDGELYWSGNLMEEEDREAFYNQSAYIPTEWRSRPNDKVKTYLKELNIHDEDLAFLRDEMDEEKSMSFLSPYEQRLLLIGRALSNKAKLIAMEEPTSGLDIIHIRKLMGWVYRLNQEEGIAFFLTTKDLEAMVEYAQKAVVLDRGIKIAEDAPVNIILEHLWTRSHSTEESRLVQFVKNLRLKDPYLFIKKFLDYEREIN